MELVEHDEELTCIPLSFEDRTHQASLRSRAIMMIGSNSLFGKAGSLFSKPGYCRAGPLLKSGIPA